LTVPSAVLISSQVDPENRSNVETTWNLIRDSLSALKITSPGNLIGVAATVLTETAHTFKPIKEFGNGKYFIKNYWDNVPTKQRLGNIRLSDSFTYCGRGFVQITGRNNYSHMAGYLGVALLDHPDLALDPINAAKILAYYWAEHGSANFCRMIEQAWPDPDYGPDYLEYCWKQVRRSVNGGLNGWNSFAQALKAFGALA
jgi:hypothetical protein